MIRNTIASLILVLAVSAVASAQDQSRFGVVVAYPGSIGAEWHLSDRAAIRPDLSFAFSGGESTGTTPLGSPLVASTDGHSVEVGVSALFYVKRWDALRAYVSPRFGYATTTTTNDSSLGGLGRVTSETSEYVTSGAIGVQYALGQRFSVFGEAGVAYANTRGSFDASLSIGLSDMSGWRVSSRAGVGAVVYF